MWIWLYFIFFVVIITGKLHNIEYFGNLIIGIMWTKEFNNSLTDIISSTHNQILIRSCPLWEKVLPLFLLISTQTDQSYPAHNMLHVWEQTHGLASDLGTDITRSNFLVNYTDSSHITDCSQHHDWNRHTLTIQTQVMAAAAATRRVRKMN
jgi:hypothetical protein